MLDQAGVSIGARILICEDEVMLRKDLDRSLSNLGYEITGRISSGREAVRMAAETRPDLILMDIKLRGKMDGIEAAERIRSQYDIPVVYVTGFSEKDILERAKRTEPYGYLSKPVRLQELRTTIETALYRHQADKRVRESERNLRVRERIARILLSRENEAEVYSAVLEVVQEALQSKYGIFGYIDEEGVLVCPSMTRDIWKECQIPEKTHVFPRKTWGGLWGRVLTQSETLYSNGPFTTPLGHVPIESALAAPIIHEGEVIGLIHVANKRSGYDERDRELMEGIGDFVAPVLAGRLRAQREEKERRKAEQNVRDERERAQAYLDAARVMMIAFDLEGNVTLVNKKTCEVLGYEADEIVGKNWFEDFLPEKWRDDVHHVFSQVISGQLTPFEYYENPIVTRTGEERLIAWYNTYVLDDSGRIVSGLASGEDITERKTAEESLRWSEDELRLTLDATTDGIWKWDFKTNQMYFSPKYYTMLGYEPDEFPATYESWVDLIHPEDLEPALQVARQYLETKPDLYENEFRLRTKSGEYRWIQAQARIVERDADGEAIRMIGNHQDITEKRFAEESLRAHAALLEAQNRAHKDFLEDTDQQVLFEGMLNNLLRVTNSEYGYIGEVFFEADGKPYQLSRAISNIAWTEELQQYYEENWRNGLKFEATDGLHGRMMSTGEPVVSNDPPNDPRSRRIPEGHPPIHTFLGLPIHRGSELVGTLGLANRPGGYDEGLVDFLGPYLSTCASIIAAYKNERVRQEAETALAQSYKELEAAKSETEALLEASQALLEHDDFTSAARVIFDQCRKVTGATSGYVALLSRDGTKNEVLFLDSGGLLCSVDPSLPMPIRGLRADAHKTGKVVWENRFSDSEWTRFMPEGHVTLVNVMFAPLRIEGKTAGLLGLSNKPGGFDQRDARLAEAFGEIAAVGLLKARALEELASSEARYRGVFDNAAVGIDLVDANGNFVQVNTALAKILGYDREELEGKSVLEVTHPDDRNISQSYLRDLRKGLVDSYRIEQRYVTRSGQAIWANVSVSAIRDAQRRHVATIGVIKDISQRKRAEAELKNSLREKEVLLREVHHRVKNNLAVICSLLGLQENFMAEQDPQEVFRDIDNRVRSLALAHEILYQTENVALVDIREYIDNLVGHLFDTAHGVESRVGLNMEISELSLSLETAIPVGFIVTELVSNALKHAFPGNRDGQVVISLVSTGPGEYELVVSDDGVGLPEEIDFKNPRSMGIDVVDTFVDQLGAEISVKRENGTEIRVTFSE